MQLRAPVALIGVDGDGYVVFVHGGVSPGDVPDAVAVVETQLRESLRLPSGAQTSLEPTLGTRALAPAFSAERLEGGGRVDLASLRGKPVVLVFFLYTCPHCHHALEFLKTELAKIPEAARPTLIGVSVAGSASAVQAQLKSDGLDFFPVLVDNDFAVRTAYGVMAGVPDIFVIDAQGGVVVRVQGWRDDRDPALMRMWLAKLAGQPVPMLLHATGYSGSEACGVCHEAETTTWLLTQHASAFDTLVRHSAAAKPDCVGCHVVGFQKTGGYTISPPAKHLENVGCESCHGRGGPHLSRGLRQEERLPGRVPQLPRPEAFARLLVRGVPAPRLARLEREVREAPARGEAEAARRARCDASGDAADGGRLRRLGRLPDVSRKGIPDLVAAAARTLARRRSRRRARPRSSIVWAATPLRWADPAGSPRTASPPITPTSRASAANPVTVPAATT